MKVKVNYFLIPNLKPVKITINGKEILLIRIDNKVYAIEPECPHKGANLEYGEIDPQLKRIKCNLHGYEFNLENGKLEYIPPLYNRSEPWFKSRDLKVYKVDVVD
ncbi:MAG: Rieske 2Fe-2S domain-containing protein, partial [Sulfolobaceae archaeon]